MLHPNFAIVGALLNMAGGASYFLDTVKGRVQPNRVSFLLWSIAPFVAFFAQVQQGIGIESVMTFSTGFVPLVVFLGSFVNKQAEWKLTRFDIWCGALSLMGLILWMITKVGNVAIFFSIMADGLAALPTLVKAWKHPETESAWIWLMSSIGAGLTLLTLDQFTFANSAFITYILIVTLLIWAFVQFRPGKRLAAAA